MAQRNLSVAKAQIQQKEKDRRILQLTIAEIGEMPQSEDIKLYKGVGKMWVLRIASLSSTYRTEFETLNALAKVPERTETDDGKGIEAGGEGYD